MNRKLKIGISTITLLLGLATAVKADTIDNYQVKLGKKLVLSEASINPVLTLLAPTKTTVADTIHVTYNHCTHGTAKRQLKLTDNRGNTVMTWNFENQDAKPVMSISVKSILLHPTISTKFAYQLCYTDEQYPTWRVLCTVLIERLPNTKATKTSVTNASNKDAVKKTFAKTNQVIGDYGRDFPWEYN